MGQLEGSSGIPAVQVAVESYYFTLSELEAAFATAVSTSRARELAAVWARTFATCVEKDAVVQLPPGYRRKRFGSNLAAECAPLTSFDTAELMKPDNALLLRFSDVTLTLLAASSRVVRERFDRLKVPYARANIADSKLLSSLLEVVRKGNPRPDRPDSN